MQLDPNKRLTPISAFGKHFNVIDPQKFEHALKLLKESLFDGGASLYSADNLITWNRNLSFLRDERFLSVLKDPSVSSQEKTIVWRTYILIYFAKISLNVEGDFVECGCHTGFTVHEVIKNLDLIKHQKKYWLYDLFEWNEGDEHTKLEGHQNPKMYENVITRFSKFPNIKIIKGSVPESFSDGFPDAISFCHIDMNHPRPEAGALKAIIPKLTKGGVIVFDDYGWWGYSAQKIALDPIADFFGQEILELPTGQAILIKV